MSCERSKSSALSSLNAPYASPPTDETMTSIPPSRAAAAAIAACGDRAPGTVWLAHISEHNNTPSLALDTIRRTLRKRGLAHVPVKTTRHRRPSLHWDSRTAPAARERQLSLF
jgi:hypothetical protein